MSGCKNAQMLRRREMCDDNPDVQLVVSTAARLKRPVGPNC